MLSRQAWLLFAVLMVLAMAVSIGIGFLPLSEGLDVLIGFGLGGGAWIAALIYEYRRLGRDEH